MICDEDYGRGYEKGYDEGYEDGFNDACRSMKDKKENIQGQNELEYAVVDLTDFLKEIFDVDGDKFKKE